MVFVATGLTTFECWLQPTFFLVLDNFCMWKGEKRDFSQKRPYLYSRLDFLPYKIERYTHTNLYGRNFWNVKISKIWPPLFMASNSSLIFSNSFALFAFSIAALFVELFDFPCHWLQYSYRLLKRCCFVWRHIQITMALAKFCMSIHVLNFISTKT